MLRVLKKKKKFLKNLFYSLDNTSVLLVNHINYKVLFEGWSRIMDNMKALLT